MVNRGNNAALAMLTEAYTYYGDCQESVAIGPYAKITSAKYCTVIGGSAQINTGAAIRASIAIGDSASCTASYSIAIGPSAAGQAVGAIQIGKGANSTAGTVCFGLSTNGSSWN